MCSHGIGEALATGFAARGAKVVLSARREDELERVRQACIERNPAETGHLVLPLDVTDYDALPAAVETVKTRCGRIDVLINNAGIQPLMWTLAEIDFENIHYYIKPQGEQARDWDDVPDFPTPEVEGENKWVMPEPFFDQLAGFLEQLPEGVEWEEGEMVYVVIGIASSSDEHINVLQSLAEALEDEEKLVSRMKALVPEFISQNSRFTKFDEQQPAAPRLNGSKKRTKKRFFQREISMCIQDCTVNEQQRGILCE